MISPVTDADRDFASMLDDLAAQAVTDADYPLAEYLFAASDFWAEPSEATVTARLYLLSAALGRQEGDR